MKVQSINNYPQTNAKSSFKAKLEIEIGPMEYLKNRPIEWRATLADDLLNSVKLLKKVISKIGTDKDIVKFKYDDWGELFYNNEKYYDDISPPRTYATTTMQRFVRDITKGTIDIYDFEKPIRIYDFKEIDGHSDIVTRKKWNAKGRELKPDTINVNDLVKAIEQLKTNISDYNVTRHSEALAEESQ